VWHVIHAGHVGQAEPTGGHVAGQAGHMSQVAQSGHCVIGPAAHVGPGGHGRHAQQAAHFGHTVQLLHGAQGSHCTHGAHGAQGAPHCLPATHNNKKISQKLNTECYKIFSTLADIRLIYCMYIVMHGGLVLSTLDYGS